MTSFDGVVRQRLLDAGAKPTQEDRGFAKLIGKGELLPLLGEAP